MIGDKVKELRKLVGITQKELAESLGLKSQTTIAAIESNKNNPSNELLSKLADFFKVSTDFLLDKVEKDGGYICLLFSAKINEMMKEKNLTVEELSKKLGIAKDTLMIIKNAQISEDIFFEYPYIASHLGLTEEDADCLMGYVAKTFVDKSKEALLTPPEPSSVLTKDFINIPIVGVVRAGQPMLASENIEGYIPLPSSMISSNKEYFALKIKGDSMNLEFNEGNIIVVEKTNIIENGEIGVILVNGYEATVKKVVQNKNMITLIPMSTNSVHTPTMYDILSDEIKVVGKVKHAIKSY